MPIFSFQDYEFDRASANISSIGVDPERDPTAESDIIAYVRTRLAAVPGAGAITVHKTETVTTII